MDDSELAEASRALASGDRNALEQALDWIVRTRSAHATALASHIEGRVLAALEREPEALEAQQRALTIDPRFAPAHYSAGALLAASGREDEALVHWTETVRLEPRNIDALFNLGLAMYKRQQFAAALQFWLSARALAPDDFEIVRRVVQALHALDRGAEAERTLQGLVALWRSSPDERVRALTDVTIDQFEIGGHRVYAFETLRPKSETLWDVMGFRVADQSGALVMTLQLETGSFGRERGVPFVVSLRTRSGYRVLDVAFASRPTYGQMKAVAREELERALAAGAI